MQQIKLGVQQVYFKCKHLDYTKTNELMGMKNEFVANRSIN